jgi:hypothetical protein
MVRIGQATYIPWGVLACAVVERVEHVGRRQCVCVSLNSVQSTSTESILCNTFPKGCMPRREK